MRKAIHILMLIIAVSCDVPIQLDPDQTASIPVIEGLITNVEDRNYVRITWTVNFYHEGAVPVVTDAVVSLDNGTDVIPFTHYNGIDPELAGYYYPPVGFVGEEGKTYTLTVQVNGITYKATETMLSGSVLDKLEGEIDPREEEDPEEEGRIYRVSIFTNEPEETKDFYLFKFYRNGSLERGSDNDIYVADDIFLSANVNGVPAPFYYAKDDIAMVELYRISEGAFNYYTGVSIAMNNDGGLFSPPPSNPYSNFDNYTPGYFMVSSLDVGILVVE